MLLCFHFHACYKSTVDFTYGKHTELTNAQADSTWTKYYGCLDFIPCTLFVNMSQYKFKTKEVAKEHPESFSYLSKSCHLCDSMTSSRHGEISGLQKEIGNS